MREHHLIVPRSARYFTLGELGPGTRDVWFVCHGYGQLAGRFLRQFEPLMDGTRFVVAPEGLSRFYLESGRGRNEKVGASWMTREDRLSEIADYVRYLDALQAEILRDVDPGTVGGHLLGFSQGTATESRWTALGGLRAERMLFWSVEVHPVQEHAAGRLA